jgi:transmembrane sensor
MSGHRDSPQAGSATVAAQAERWFARMRSDRVEPVDEFRFRNWLAEDPAHEREYRLLETFWDELTAYGRADEVRAMSHVALVQTCAVEEVPAAPAYTRARRVRRWSAAAAVAVLIGGLFAANPTIYTATYETGIGGRNSHHLLEGTRITLNTDTALRVQYDLRSRRVWLENGQAHFQVTRSRFWPFEVDAGTSVVRALGTTFDVYRRGDETQVTLLEGRLRVEKARVNKKGSGPLKLTHEVNEKGSDPFLLTSMQRAAVLEPGQQVVISPRGLSDVHLANVPETTAWLYGRLVFDGERLADAVAEVNRYSPVQLTIENPDLADVRISGVFRAGGAETFVDALEASFPVQARVRDDGSLVLAANVDGPLPSHINGLSR